MNLSEIDQSNPLAAPPKTAWDPTPRADIRQLFTLPRTQRAILVWMGKEQRQRRTVGEFLRTEKGVEFRYTIGGSDFNIALNEGFSGYPGVPIDRAPGANAFQNFERRLPFGRSDLIAQLQVFGLGEIENFEDRLSILAFTGARIARDSFGILDTFEGFETPFSYIFDVAGFRRNAVESALNLNPAMGLCLVPDSENKFDATAVRVETNEGQVLGFIPASQSSRTHEWLSQGTRYTASVHRINGRPGYPRCFVWVDLL